jgi:glycosyltransferase involved in cell wall biosynthesis
MRIAVTNWSNRLTGGAEQYIASLSELLLTAGHEFALWHEGDAPRSRPLIPVCSQICTWNVGELGSDCALAKLRQWRPDVIYGQGMQDTALEQATLSIAPSVFFAHNHHGTCISGSKAHLFPIARPCRRKFGRACLLHYLPRRCGGLNPITMIGQYSLNVRRLDTVRRYSMLITHAKSIAAEYRLQGITCDTVRYFGADLADSDRGTEDWSPAASWRLLMMGRMMSTKGGSLLLDTVPRVVHRLKKPLLLTIAGDGPCRERWQNKALRLQARNPGVQVAFPGWVSGASKYKLLAESDLLLIPSVWPEPYGVGGDEAGAMGVPSVAFRVGGIPDWLVDGVNGTLAPGDPPSSAGLADAIVRALTDETRYRSLREGAMRSQRERTKELHYQDLLAVFERLLGIRGLVCEVAS